MSTIRGLFSGKRSIDRPIEKVIDYTADDPVRLRREIEEYVVTERLEDRFRQFIDRYEAGVRMGDVTDVGIWVSGFYGSGKSSFTKYLGFALDGRSAGDVPFLDLLTAHFRAPDLQQLFRATAAREPAAVVMLDLAREQLVESTAVPITNVLYAKVLQQVGYSKVPKLADLEVRLDDAGRLDDFRRAYRDRFPRGGEWDEVHDDALIGPARASQLVPGFLPDFPTPESFRQQHFQERLQVAEYAERMIRLVRRKTGRRNIVFLVDEVGQYVAPRTDLMLNLDGLVRSFKELGRGTVWFVATAQQTLDAIVEKAILNSAELIRLRDRFASIVLDAADIREITHKRLLTKRAEGERRLEDLHRQHAQELQLYTRVDGFSPAASAPLDDSVFAQMYPFLPVHFDLVMELIRRLARRTGGTGLRSAIRVVQDLLVDASHSLPPGAPPPLADREVGRLACADDIYDTLRADITKEFPHVVEGADRVEAHPTFGQLPLAVRVAKAVAALQPLDGFPRTAENIAAVLYPHVGRPPVVAEVREVLHQLVEAREFGLVEIRGENEVEGPGDAGYLFLSDRVRPLQQSRDAHRPTGAEKRQVQADLLRLLFDPQPETRLQNVRPVRAGLYVGNLAVAGEGADVRFLLEPASASSLDERLDELKALTRTRADWQATIIWLVPMPPDLEDLLTEACRSAHLARTTSEQDQDRDVSQYIRAEKRRLERLREAARARLAAAMHDGWFVFQSRARPVREYDADSLPAAENKVLAEAAAEVYREFRHAPLNARTEQAAKFLEWERLDRAMPADRDPLKLVEVRAGRARVRTTEPPLSVALDVLRQKVDAAGTGRIQGTLLQELFAAPPYGWSKDTTRYLFAALLAGGEVEFHTPAGVLRTPGPSAVEAVRNTAAFNRIGVAPRGSRPSMEVLDRAARLLEGLFGSEVLPLEDHISRAVRAQVPPLMEKIGALPDRLRLLGLKGQDRARAVLQGCSDLLQEDAGGAASLLGAPDSPLPGHVRWAREAVECLDNEGEEQIVRATALRREIGELGELFPQLEGLARSPALETIAEVLGSERFPDRMADLRGALLTLSQATAALFAETQSAYRAALDQARRELEGMPEWAGLDPEDRAAVSARLAADEPSAGPGPARSMTELRRLLTRTARLPGLLEESQREARRRTPPAAVTPPPALPAEQDLEDAEREKEQVLTLRAVAPPRLLRSADDVERWLGDLRRRLLELVELGPLRLIDREED